MAKRPPKTSYESGSSHHYTQRQLVPSVNSSQLVLKYDIQHLNKQIKQLQNSRIIIQINLYSEITKITPKY